MCSDTFPISVKALQGTVYTVLVSPGNHISHLKWKLHLYQGFYLPVDCIKLTFKNRELSDEDTVESCGIQQDSTLHLVSKNRVADQMGVVYLVSERVNPALSVEELCLATKHSATPITPTLSMKR